MKKYLLMILSAVVICAVFTSCEKSSKKTDDDNSTTQTTATEVYQPMEQMQTANVAPVENSTQTTQAQTTGKAATVASQPQVTEKKNSDTTVKHSEQNAPTKTESTTVRELKKTGEMEFSDSAKNKYLTSVAKKYKLDTDNLVAIYTVPDNNGNLVLEFNGELDENGKPIRTAETLIAIYSIDKELNSKRASENTELNEYSYGEMKVMFMSTTKYIMPKFEKELKG